MRIAHRCFLVVGPTRKLVGGAVMALLCVSGVARATDTITVYADDCTTPKTTFAPGETVCAVATGISAGFLSHVYFAWSRPGGSGLNAATITANGQTEKLTMTGVNNVSGGWRAEIHDSSDGSLRAFAPFSLVSGNFYSVPACRHTDTRSGPPLNSTSAYNFGIIGFCGVPSSATAVVLNVTAIDATAPGYLVVFPFGTSNPGTSTLNFVAGITRANNVATGLGSGSIKVKVNTAGTTHLLIDVLGYFD